MDKAKVIKIFALIILVVFSGIIIWDIFLYSDDVPGNSITQSIIYYSHKFPLIALWIGYATGFIHAHFYG